MAPLRHLTRPSRLVAVAVATLLALTTAPLPAQAVDQTKGYAGRCTGADATTGTTMVIDFQQLDGNGGTAAPTIVRCSPAPANGAARTGLQALKDAGISITGVARWGESFICRIEGRPSATESVPIASNPQYKERCVDTPPASGYWGYWHADGKGQDWQYSSYGVTNRTVTPGGFDGWSFSLNATATTNPKPRLAGGPVNGALDPTTPAVAVSSSSLTPSVAPGTSVTLSWQTSNATSLTASGAWSGALTPVASGQKVVKPTTPGQHVYTLTAKHADGRTASTSYTLTVTGSAPSPSPNPKPPASSGAASTAAWLIRDLEPAGEMPAPLPTPAQPTDWGLTIDTLWALHAAGTGARAAQQITAKVDRNAGDYLGVKLFRDADVRRAGQTAKVLLAAIVAGKDPRSFGRVMTSKGAITSARYDLRQETLDLVDPDTGRLQDRGLGIDNTNVFSQSLAVMGLARSGGVDRLPVDYLLRQQCSDGYFRMFDRRGRTCDQDDDASDGDGTAMGIQALMTAKAAGVGGLDDDIDRGIAWLVRVQRKDGSFGGGVSTESSNTNSTGLVAQTLRAAGRTAAYGKARDYVASLTVTTASGRGTQLADERGAIAYNGEALSNGKATGIRGRDQWRRATAQAIFALAPVSFVDLGKKRLGGDPSLQGRDHARGPGASGVPPAGAPGARRASDLTVVDPPKGSAPVEAPTAAGPAGRLGSYLAGRLVEGDHVEVTDGRARYVDYDLTASVVLSLRQLREQPKAAERASRFLLDRRSVAASVHGKPYETSTATYAEPLARLALVARSAASTKLRARADTLLDDLQELEGRGGRYDDTGTYAADAADTARQSWIALALASGRRDTGAAAAPLTRSVCRDGSVPRSLGADCRGTDLVATSLAAQALNATSGPRTATRDLVPAAASRTAFDSDRREAVAEVAGALQRASHDDGRLVDGTQARRPGSVSDVAGGRQAVGYDVTAVRQVLAPMMRRDGGAPRQVGQKRSDLEASAASSAGLSGRSWLSTPGLGLAPGLRATTPAATGPGASGFVWTPLTIALVALGAALLLGATSTTAFVLGRRSSAGRTPHPPRSTT